MHAVRIHTTGSSSVMAFESAPDPEIAPNEVLIRVHAASVNPVDCKIRLGEYAREAIEFPLILGRDVSGVISRVGSEVRDCGAGDEVYALLGAHSGGYAELAVARAGEYARKPKSLDHVHAAAVPLAALTAWQGLFDHGGLRAGQAVLIHGAGGGVGHFAVQFARNCGAHVIGTAAAEDLDLVSNLGADLVIDFDAMPFQDVVTQVDLVLDLVAGETQKRSWSVLREGGTLVSALGEPARDDGTPTRAQGKGFLARPDADQLRRIAEMIDAGRVSVVVSKTLPLADAREAHDQLESEHSQGKTVLLVAGV
jgi:NADPH:quinone reductase-like Zn-dependent oxidoreductase